jgi:Flp pilus assembly protein TadD
MKYIFILIFAFQLIYANNLEDNKIEAIQKINKYHKTYNKFFLISKKAVQKDTQDYKSQAFLGYYYMKKGSDYSIKLARFHFLKANEYDSNNPKHLYMIGILYGLDGDLTNARKYFQIAKDFDSTTKVFTYLFAHDKYNMRREIKNYNNAIESDLSKKSKKMAYFLNGLVYVDNNQLPLAIKEFEKILKNYSKNKNALYGLSIAYQKDMQYNKSKDVYAKLIELYPSYFLGYLGYFEIQLVLDEKWEDEKINFFLREFSAQTAHLAQFELLKIIRSAIDDKDYLSEFSRWNNYYKDIDVLEYWSIDELLSWAYTINDEKKRKRLLKILETFKPTKDDDDE